MDISIGYQIVPLFANPVFSVNLLGRYNQDDLITEIANTSWSENHSNSMSSSTDWLDGKEIKTIIEAELNYYFYEVLQVVPDTEIYITESWANKSTPNEQHHRHNHPNSIVSGVFYVDTDEYTGNIVFNTSQYSQIEFQVKESNIYNSKTWSFAPMIGTLILFPSSLEHSVTKNLSKKDRISISFNTFIKGNISKTPLASLKI